MPRTLGDGIIHMSQIDYLVEGDVPLPTKQETAPTEEDEIIGQLIADNLVTDGSCLQA